MLKIHKELFSIFLFLRELSNINRRTCDVVNIAEIAVPIKTMAICVILPYSLVGA